LREYKGIFVVGEFNQKEEKRVSKITLELMGLGQQLVSKARERLYAVLFGHGIGICAEELSRYGAEEIFVLDDEILCEYNPDTFLPFLHDLFLKKNPKIILLGHTSMGQDLAPRLAFSLKAGLVTDCVGVESDSTGFSFIKPIYGGNILATLRVTTPITIVTVRARVGESPTPSEPCMITPLDTSSLPHSRIVIKKRVQEEQREYHLEEAKVVVSGGRGMGGEEGFAALRELAQLLGGAVGASRPPVDAGWTPATCQVGITGKVVAPELYIAVGISGSSQHLSGMGDSGKIVAVNKDPEAYIFRVSDYGVVGDWREVLPAFTSRLREFLSG
jgi:electron transfer flavoprotein alpha subunit